MEISIGDIAQEIIQLVGRPVRLETKTERVRPTRSEVTRLVATNQKARDLLGWTPKVPLQEGLRQTIDYIRDHLEDYEPDRYTV